MVIIREGVILREICGVPVLFSTVAAAAECPYYCELNETAADFWRLMEKGCTEEEIVSAIAAEYEAPEELIRRDYRLLIDELRKKGYLLPEDSSK